MGGGVPMIRFLLGGSQELIVFLWWDSLRKGTFLPCAPTLSPSRAIGEGGPTARPGCKKKAYVAMDPPTPIAEPLSPCIPHPPDGLNSLWLRSWVSTKSLEKERNWASLEWTDAQRSKAQAARRSVGVSRQEREVRARPSSSVSSLPRPLAGPGRARPPLLPASTLSCALPQRSSPHSAHSSLAPSKLRDWGG